MGKRHNSHIREPYRLPEPLYCDPADIPESGPDMEMIDKYIRLHTDYMRRYEYLESLYKGFHDIFRQPEKHEWKPDWRLAINFPRYITDTFCGYGYSIPPKVAHEDEIVDEGIQTFEDANEIEAHTTIMTKYCCIYGHAQEYMYQDEESRTNVVACSPKELFTVYDDTMKRRALFSIRYGRHSIGDNKGEIYGEVLMPHMYRSFDSGKLGETVPNPYGRIPVVEWMLNPERMGLYEPVTGLIEMYNHTISEKTNDVDAFAEAILAVIGAEVQQEDLENMRDKRLVNLYGAENVKDALVQYLTKPTADDTQEHLLDRAERLIYQIAMVANISDDTFGSSTSGAALSYKLWSTSNITGTFDTLIKKSLRKRYKLWCSLPTNCPRDDIWKDLTITTTRNVPRNIQEETQTASQAEGLVSRKTQLSLLSYVPDPDAEMEQIVREQEEMEARNEERMNRLYGGDDAVIQTEGATDDGEDEQGILDGA